MPVCEYTPEELAALMDYTLLKPDASEDEIRKLCFEAIDYGFCSVCVNPANVALATALLAFSPVKVCSVVAFPLGASATEVKVFEARHCVYTGCDEIDIVADIAGLISGDYRAVEKELAAVVAGARDAGRKSGRDIIVKVIIETALLPAKVIPEASRVVVNAGADFVKTSTGFARPLGNVPSGATVEAVSLIKSAVGNAVGIKASGGIGSLEKSIALIRAGATRLGVSSGVKIIEELRSCC